MAMTEVNSVRRVAVLRGGPSDEYEISMQTGASVLAALQGLPGHVDDIVITKNGEWLKEGRVRRPDDALAATDVVFIALHGAYGEDGTVQRILQRLAIPYTGSKPYPSAMAMNKLLTKEYLRKHGIRMAPHFHLNRDSTRDVGRTVHTIIDLFGPEYVIKPTMGGSSIGTRTANSPSSLVHAIEELFETYSDILVEERLRGREATCGVVERFRNESIYSLPSIEIIPPQGSDFFSIDVKYSGKTQELCPSRFSTAEKRQLEEIARTVHQLMDLSQYSRSDFIVTSDGIFFLEVNTLPGLTTESLMPKALTAIGCNYSDFIQHLLTDATRSVNY